MKKRLDVRKRCGDREACDEEDGDLEFHVCLCWPEDCANEMDSF